LIEYTRLHYNLIITPHIGGATQESIEKADMFIARKIGEYFSSL
jgi:phosphoglycerate dehydrogenase-like enzyme